VRYRERGLVNRLNLDKVREAMFWLQELGGYNAGSEHELPEGEDRFKCRVLAQNLSDVLCDEQAMPRHPIGWPS
jgi:hypothetical protein